MVAKKMNLLLVFLCCLVLVPLSAWAGGVPCASWKDAEMSLRKAWAKGYPTEKILSIVQDGEPSSYDKLKSTGQTKIDAHGDKWEFYAKNSYCRVPAKVTVRQSSGQRVFSVSAIYRKSGKGFVFDDMGVGQSSAVAPSAQQAPSKDEFKKMIAAYWLELHPETKVETVKATDAEYKNDSSTGRWWYNIGADIYIVSENGARQKCSNDYTTLYKGEKGKEGVDASGPWKVYFLDDPSCR
ncbi:hypothetical protein FY034_15175 [Trichlorobacter lovleyi]|uniref:hypothetical protein n=1 Tax=Trichlorobacter lovleyi TaxID=313985 RepID=UPI0022409C2C|nr:hypothetical protein [Trichlorobacter lovleyi]QOX80219.1 hypothetical protein FY034_15175 [Trichlorobacter lovleyi]